jgi:hypothetical protein
MKTRCLNPRAENFEYYGGRGITVCERWLKFENFYVDVGEPPEGMTLDRINNDGNYEPGNWRWATMLEQNHNRRPRKLTCECMNCHNCKTREMNRERKKQIEAGTYVAPVMCQCGKCRTCYVREWARKKRERLAA